MRRWTYFAVALVQTAFADCNLTADDWGHILQGLASPNFFGYFNGAGDCNDTSTGHLLNKYGDCTSTLENVLSSRSLASNCPSVVSSVIYTGNGVLDSAGVITESLDICGRSLGNGFIKTYLCDPTEVPGCPSVVQVPKFAPLISCLGQNKSLSELQQFFTTGEDKTCLVSRSFCESFVGFQTCLNSFQDIVDFIYTSQDHNCTDLMRGAPDIEQRCAQSVATMYSHYCEKSFLQKNLLALAVGIPSAVIGLSIIFLCVKRLRRGYITDQELLASIEDNAGKEVPEANGASFYSTSPGSVTSHKEVHPELAAVMEMKSKYKGITFDARERKWRSIATGQLFLTEMEAAQASYFAQVRAASPQVNGTKMLVRSPSSPSPLASSLSNNAPIAAYVEEPEIKIETPEEKRARRIRQLINFYEYWDADKPDIPGHAENLFMRHDFTHVARAVKTKFGVLPPGWEDELEEESV